MRSMITITAAVITAVACSAVAHADPDTDFSNQLHTLGIYGSQDFNAWIAKIVCERLDRDIDRTGSDSATFTAHQLASESTIEQVWQFVGAAYQT